MPVLSSKHVGIEMNVGDLVRQCLTDQIGIVLCKKGNSYQVLWTTQGLSLFAAGFKEWTSPAFVEVINESR